MSWSPCAEFGKRRHSCFLRATQPQAVIALASDRLWSLEVIKAEAVMFGVHKIKHSVLFRERCHADLHLARAFYFGRRQGHAG